MPIKYIERPRATRIQTLPEANACDAHTERSGDCIGCPHLLHATRFDVYCAQGYVWPAKEPT